MGVFTLCLISPEVAQKKKNAPKKYQYTEILESALVLEKKRKKKIP